MSDKRKNKKSDELITLSAPAKEKRADICIFVLLFAFGLYLSINYWGHQPVPHFDFNCFQATSRPLLSFEPPIDYKRTPLVGLLHIWLGNITGGAYPELQGGWLLNSISHTLTAVLLWLAGRHIIGKPAIWFAIIAIINPFGLQLLTEAIAETPMLFFVWLTFYLIFIRSRWAYLAASLASMVRYECAALIFGMFVMDMIYGNKKQRVMAFVYSAAASIPLGLWLLGTFLEGNTGDTHYLNIFSKDYINQFTGGKDKSTGFLKNAYVLWQTGFLFLLQSSPQFSESFIKGLAIFSQVFVATAFFFGSIYGLIKKQWKILVMLIFLVPYFIVHAKYPYPIHRYYTTVFGIVMLIGIYGIAGFWNLVKRFVPKTAIICAQAVLLITCLIWALTLWGYLPEIATMSRASVWLPYISILVLAIAFAAGLYVCRKNIFTRVVIIALMLLMIVSNQFGVAQVVGNGQRDIEFKYLADWYCQNAKPDEKLVTTVPIILTIMSPQYKDNFIHTATFDANSPDDFVRECYQKNITYIAWDSRMGLTPANVYYKSWKMSNIAPLALGRDVGPYQFITQIRVNQRSYVNIYRLRPISEVLQK